MKQNLTYLFKKSFAREIKGKLPRGWGWPDRTMGILWATFCECKHHYN